MNKKAFPNFWQALLMISLWAITNLTIWAITMIMRRDHNDSVLYQIIHVILIELNFIPYIVFLIKKTNIRIWDYFAIPDFNTLLKLVVVSLLLRFVISIPLDYSDDFFNLLANSKIKFHSIDIFDNKMPAIVIALRWVFIPVIEEILYRGLILGGFLKRYTPTQAILLSSLIFSFAHLNIERFFSLLILGVILGIFYYKTNSILVSSISHFIFNMAIILKFKIHDFNPVDLIVYISIFLISIWIVVYLLRKPMKTVKISRLSGGT